MQRILRKYHCTIDLLFDRFGISCMITDKFCSYLQNRLIQTSQTGGQWYSDTSPFSIPCYRIHICSNLFKVSGIMAAVNDPNSAGKVYEAYG
jgi:hypothetical protein